MKDFNSTLSISVDKQSANNDMQDSVAVNIVAYKKGTSRPVINLPIVFITNGHSIIKESGTPVTVIYTQTNGSAIGHILNNIAETVGITCYPKDEPENKIRIDILFHEPYEKLNIFSVKNSNHEFSAGQPTYIWNGAFFIISATGGSGQYEWFIENTDSQINLVILEEPKSIGIYINEASKGEKTIFCKDITTNEIVSYTFNVNFLLERTQDTFLYQEFIENNPDITLLKRFEFLELFREWGDMSKNEGWGGEYWIKREFVLDKIFNLNDGTERSVISTNVKSKITYLK